MMHTYHVSFPTRTKKFLTYLIKLQFQVRITRGHTEGDKETYVLILLQRIPTWEDQGEDHNPPDFPHQSVATSSHYYLIWIKSCTIKPVLKRIQVNFENVCLFVFKQQQLSIIKKKHDREIVVYYVPWCIDLP